MHTDKTDWTEEDKRRIRVGYRVQNGRYIYGSELEELPQKQKEALYLVGRQELKKERNKEIAGIIVFITIVVAIVTVVKIHNHRVQSAQAAKAAANGCYTAQEASSHVGQTGCVDYHVGYTYETSAGTKFLDQYQDYSSGFVGYIPYNSSAEQDINLNDYNDKDIQVSGTIATYNGYTEIEIDNSSQVMIQ